MNDTTDRPAALVDTLEHLGLSELLVGFVPRAHVVRRVSWQEFTRFIEGQGYTIVKEHNNVYGKVGVRRATPTTAPRLRLATRSDVAAVYGSRRRAA